MVESDPKTYEEVAGDPNIAKNHEGGVQLTPEEQDMGVSGSSSRKKVSPV